MQIRDRIRELRRVPARSLVPHPKNWRTHPDRQRDALKGILAEIGYADALLARELPDGSLQLIDGHLRAETTPDREVPVLVLDLDEAEAEKLLALLDPLASLAGTNRDLLADIVSHLETKSETVQKMLDEMLSRPEIDLPFTEPPLKDLAVPELFQVLIQCENEEEQREVFEQLTAAGHTCKIMNL